MLWYTLNRPSPTRDAVPLRSSIIIVGWFHYNIDLSIDKCSKKSIRIQKNTFSDIYCVCSMTSYWRFTEPHTGDTS